MIVEREREIRAFLPEEYWTVQADLEPSEQNGDSLVSRFDVKKYQGKAFRPSNKEQTDTALAFLRNADYMVSKREDRATKSNPRHHLLRPHCNRLQVPSWAMALRKP